MQDKRISSIWKKPFVSIAIAIMSGFIVAAIVLACAGFAPFGALSALFEGIFSKPKHIIEIIMKSTPIILTGISVAFAFKTGLFNIGAEGQFIMGAAVATIVGITLDLPPIVQVPIILLAGSIAGAVWGCLVGYLKAKFGIHEVITSIMMNWIAFYFSNFIAKESPFHRINSEQTHAINKSGFTMILNNWKETPEGSSVIKSSPLLKDLFSVDLSYGIIIAVVIGILISWLLNKTTKGYELRAVGFNADAAEFAGINVKRNIVSSMCIAGAIAGLAGVLSITGVSPHAISNLNMFDNNGFNGLSVALIGGLSPIGCIFAGLFFGALVYGGRSIQSQIHAPSEIVNIMIGTVVFFVALTKIIPELVDKHQKRRVKKA